MADKYKKNACRFLIIFGALLLLAITVKAAEIYPLEPPDTSSPRATLKSFLDIMREDRILMDQDPYLESKASQLRDEQLEELTEKLFDFSDIPVERVEDIANYVRPLMVEILDRIEIPPMEAIPDADAVQVQNLTRWTIPHSEITFVKIEEGPRQGQWLFSADTVKRLKEFYERVKDLPYRPDAAMGYVEPFGGPYQRYVLLPEESFPDRWIKQLPGWLRAVYFENPVWKWLAFGLILSISFGLFALISRVSRRLGSQTDTEQPNLLWWRLVPPISGALLAKLAENLIDEQINAVGFIDAVFETVLWVISLLFWAWAVIGLGDIVSRAFVRSWQSDPKSVKHYLTSIFIRLLSYAIAVWIVLYGIEGFGLSIMPLLAGLGVGGIAIALAVRPTLENFIGGIILFMDKPIEVGDICQYDSPSGSQIGIVEKIGLRSTRLRKFEDTLITIPNAEFSQLQIENLSIREMTLMRFTLNLRYETTADQLRFVLTHLRMMMIGHPKVSPERLRVRFRGFGDSSLDVEIFAYIRTNTYPEYWAIREDINLRIIDIVKEAGTGFAFPSQTTYFTQDTGLDKEKSRDSEAQVEKWRSDNNLPFPEVEGEEQEQFADTLDYPPAGSSAHRANSHDSIGQRKKNNSSAQSKPAKTWEWKRHQRPDK